MREPVPDTALQLAESDPVEGWSAWLAALDRKALVDPLVQIWQAEDRVGLFTPHADTFLALPGERAAVADLEGRLARLDAADGAEAAGLRALLWPQLRVVGLLDPRLAAARTRALRDWGLPGLVDLVEAVQARERWADDPVRRAALGLAPLQVAVDLFRGGSVSTHQQLGASRVASLERTLSLHQPRGAAGTIAVRQGSWSARLCWHRDGDLPALVRVETG